MLPRTITISAIESRKKANKMAEIFCGIQSFEEVSIHRITKSMYELSAITIENFDRLSALPVKEGDPLDLLELILELCPCVVIYDSLENKFYAPCVDLYEDISLGKLLQVLKYESNSNVQASRKAAEA